MDLAKSLLTLEEEKILHKKCQVWQLNLKNICLDNFLHKGQFSYAKWKKLQAIDYTRTVCFIYAN